jgi:tripartite-type tricarboxylate transporter receptor subunit TctC
MLMTRAVALRISLTIVWIAGTGAVFSQPYPNKPIRIITGGVGGGVDIAARQITQLLLTALGQPVIVDNRSSGSIPGQIVSKAPPDGYTLLATASTFWIMPLLEITPYDPIDDFSPITLMTSSPALLVVHPSVPANSVKELITLAKAKPGVLNYASSQPGSSNHLAAELFKAMAGVNIMGITYKSVALGINDVLGGHVQMMFPSTSLGTPHLRAGRVRGLGVTSLQPSALVPGLPAVAASGLPGFESVSFTGVFAPAKTPTTIITKLNQEIVRVLNRPDVKEKFLGIGAESVGSSPAEFTAKMKFEMTRLGKVIKDSGIKAE